MVFFLFSKVKLEIKRGRRYHTTSMLALGILLRNSQLLYQSIYGWKKRWAIYAYFILWQSLKHTFQVEGSVSNHRISSWNRGLGQYLLKKRIIVYKLCYVQCDTIRWKQFLRKCRHGKLLYGIQWWIWHLKQKYESVF